MRSSNEVGADVLVFHETLGISDNRATLEKKRWAVAAIEARDSVRDAGASGIETVTKLGAQGAEAVGSFSVDVANNAKDVAGSSPAQSCRSYAVVTGSRRPASSAISLALHRVLPQPHSSPPPTFSPLAIGRGAVLVGERLLSGARQRGVCKE